MHLFVFLCFFNFRWMGGWMTLSNCLDRLCLSVCVEILSVQLYICCLTDRSGGFWRPLPVCWTCKLMPFSHLCLPVQLVSHWTGMTDMSGSLLPLRFHPCGPRKTDLPGSSRRQLFFLHSAGPPVNSWAYFLEGCMSNFPIRMINAVYSLCFRSSLYIIFVRLPSVLFWFLSRVPISLVISVSESLISFWLKALTWQSYDLIQT